MEIGITWENELVYNKEIKINKKAIKIGGVIVGVLGVALLVSFMPGTTAYALDTTNKNGELIKNTVLNTAQGKDAKYIWELLSSANNDIVYNKGILNYSKDTIPDIYDMAKGLDAKKLNTILDSLIDRYATYAQGEVDVIKVLKSCILN